MDVPRGQRALPLEGRGGEGRGGREGGGGGVGVWERRGKRGREKGGGESEEEGGR